MTNEGRITTSPNDHSDVVIVGGGHAGAQTAIALRQHGFDGSITIIGRENEPPYERPPLSKEYLSKEKPFERLYIRPISFWAEKHIDLELGVEVTSLDATAKFVTMSDGRKLFYGQLVWAAGGEPRRLSCPGAELASIHYIRTRVDCDNLTTDIAHGARNFAIIGGGYIGLEAAAVLTKLGCKVTLIEAMPRVLARVAGPALSAFFEQEHRHHGVTVRTGVSVASIEGQRDVTGVMLESGELIAADAVIVGIGIVPSVAPLVEAGAKCGNGVEVDRFCRTSLPHVYAIGDCAAFPCFFGGGAIMRIESVQNANDQATCVAKAICGAPQPYAAFPWFWSNQFDLRLQTAGISAGFDATITRGDPGDRSFSVAYLKNGKLIAIDSVNATKDYVQGRKLVEAGGAVDIVMLADSSVALKDLIPAI